ncbi:MAG: hypothetical protein OEZ39_08180 [Gammaproteobacteria bacterium]|nr:hypothetical protein [Gammaproteobacteria bacterium]MDH5651838.1 hypothetical protein [Gammaproteobacteria bacterium]
MKKVVVNKGKIVQGQCQDKTDWKRVYNETQSNVDRNAKADNENPVLTKARFHRLKDNKGKS